MLNDIVFNLDGVFIVQLEDGDAEARVFSLSYDGFNVIVQSVGETSVPFVN